MKEEKQPVCATCGEECLTLMLTHAHTSIYFEETIREYSCANCNMPTFVLTFGSAAQAY